MATRTVTGPMLGPIDNQPLADFKLTFTVTKRADGTVQYTDDGHYPWHEVEIVTDTNGDFALDMVTGITYAVQFTGAIQDDGRVQSYPPGIGFKLEFVVPHGETPISLQTIRAMGNLPPDLQLAIDGGGPGSSFGNEIDGGEL